MKVTFYSNFILILQEELTKEEIADLSNRIKKVLEGLKSGN
ncbi:Imm3 family immunity protein [Bacillus sp. DX4.1]|nr:Imm3 family immunity protein [Bacillus sp. DX4.1]MDM5186314.1 Imm3 family immunity protein [Bacillus sp. DX4.1]